MIGSFGYITRSRRTNPGGSLRPQKESQFIKTEELFIAICLEAGLWISLTVFSQEWMGEMAMDRHASWRCRGVRFVIRVSDRVCRFTRKSIEVKLACLFISFLSFFVLFCFVVFLFAGGEMFHPWSLSYRNHVLWKLSVTKCFASGWCLQRREDNKFCIGFCGPCSCAIFSAISPQQLLRVCFFLFFSFLPQNFCECVQCRKDIIAPILSFLHCWWRFWLATNRLLSANCLPLGFFFIFQPCSADLTEEARLNPLLIDHNKIDCS